MTVTLALALAGCGGSTTAVGDLPADAVFLSAVDRSTDISTLRVEYESTSHLDGELVTHVRGEATFAPGAAALSATMEGMGGGDAPAVVYEMRFVDGTMYVRIPPEQRTQAEADLDGVEWIAYDLADEDDAGVATQLDQLDFAATLQALRDSAGITEDGRETIAGVETTRYVGTTTLRAVMRAQGTPEEHLEEQVAPDDGPDLDEPMPLTVWIGGDGLVRRYDYVLASGGFETVQSMTVLEYGPEVDITAPPAATTISGEDFDSFQGQIGGRPASDFSDSEEYRELEMGEVEGSAGGSITVEAEGGATAEPVPAPRSSNQPTGDGDS